MSAILAAFLSLTSAVAVALVSHYFTVRRKRKDEMAEMRLKAYVDFINAASRLIAARRLGNVADEIEDLAILNDAKTRICICGEASVVEALSEFWHHGGTLEKESEILAFTKLCMRIRESIGCTSNDILELNLSSTLFKQQPATYSFARQKHTEH